MTVQIENFRIVQYQNNLQLLSQQTKSKFEAAVTGGTYQGKKISPVNFIGSSEMQQQTSRNEDINYSEKPTDRRWILPDKLYYDAQLIETQDKVESLSNMEGGYAAAHVAAANRKKDDVIISKFFSSAYTGEEGVTPTAFKTSTQVVAVATGAAAATGLNYDKLVAAIEIFGTNDVDLEAEPLYMGIGPKQNSNLLKQAEAIQEKYQVKAVIVKGRVMEMAGINFIHSTRLQKDGNNYTRCPIWMPSGMQLGTWQKLSGLVRQNTRKVGNPMEVYHDMMVGGTRLDELKVAEVKCA